MENSRFDLFYEEKGYPWHYRRQGENKNFPSSNKWFLIAEDQPDLKLNFFTSDYFEMRLNYDPHISDIYKNPPAKTVKTLWYEFEVFMIALMEQIVSREDFIEFLKDYETPNLSREIYPKLSFFGYQQADKFHKHINHQWQTYDFDGRLTINRMLKIEPNLKIAIDYVKKANSEAKGKVVWWAHVWINAKKLCIEYIGWMAEKKELKNSQCWDAFHDHLKSLATNCR